MKFFLHILSAASILSVFFFFQNCAKVNFEDAPSVAISSLEPEPPADLEPQYKNCALASGALIAHGAITVRFKKNSEGRCETLQPSMCVDGVLSGDGAHNDTGCSIKRESALAQNPANTTKCVLGSQSLYAGSFVIAFKKKSPGVNEGCVAEVRICGASGTLSGTFTEPYCQIRAAVSAETIAWDSVTVPDGAVSLGFPEKVKAANGAFTLNYVYSDSGAAKSGRSNSATVGLPEARWSREKTVWDVSDRAFVVLGHNDENKNLYTVSFNGKTNANQCRAQIESALNNWVDLSPTAFACDSLFAVKVLKIDSNIRWWTSYNKVNNARMRLVDHLSGAEVAVAEGTFKCGPTRGSSVATPDIDEDCDGYWDNMSGGLYY